MYRSQVVALGKRLSLCSSQQNGSSCLSEVTHEYPRLGIADADGIHRLNLVTFHRRRSEPLRVAGRVLEDHAGLFALAVAIGLRLWVL